MDNKISFIAPASSKLADEFYKHFSQGKLYLQRCTSCSTWHHIPRTRCADCGSYELQWAECSGNGELFSWTETCTAPLSSLQEDVPFIVALVQLEEGQRVVARLVNVSNDELVVGLKLRVKFEAIAQEFSLAVFEPA